MPNKDEQKVIDLQRSRILLVEDGNHGEYRPRPNEFGSGDTAFIRAADMEAGRVHFESADRIKDVALARITKGIGRGGDVLFSHKGTVGKLALAPLDAPPFVCSPQTTFWRTLDEERLNRRYLYYFMSSRRFWEQWHSRKGETDMADYVSLTAQRELFVVLPHIDEQRAIARTLGALDDKIELNRQMTRTLEALAQALFKSWFVDFDPVTAKAAGRKPYGMNEETAALFHNRFVESELGLIPEGWHVKTINEATSLIIDYRGKTPKKLGSEWSKIGIPAISAKNIKSGRMVNKESMNFVDEVLYERWMKDKLAVGDTLMTSEAPLGELLYLAATSKFCLSQRVFALRADPAECLSSFLYFWLLTETAQESLQSRATGTTVEGIRQSELRKVEVLLPPLIIQERANSILENSLTKISLNEEESETLATLRDSLLPKLLSGEIRVAQAESLVAEAV